jgi:hypothetical protein
MASSTRVFGLRIFTDSFVTPLAINALRACAKGAILSRHIAGHGSARVMQLDDVRCGSGRSAPVEKITAAHLSIRTHDLRS